MAHVFLDIDDDVNRLTLRAMLEAEGHNIVQAHPQAVIADDAMKAIHHAKSAPTLVLATLNDLRAAVAAMRQGVHGYIFVPFQPGEAAIMVRRALAEAAPEGHPQLLPLQAVEERHISEVLRQCKGNRAKAARILGIGRNTLWRKLGAMESRQLKPDKHAGHAEGEEKKGPLG